MDQPNIPKKIFIVPYRNRETHRLFFIRYMQIVLEDMPKNEYEIYFSHQTDNRIFNRGAVKNIGFLAMKNKYPTAYKQITFIFHDVDIVPYDKNIFPYDTKKGEVQHYYGFTFALGGIFSIKGIDFERINGFPTYWGWGLEDNCLQKRCIKHGCKINREHFYKLGNKNVLHISDTVTKKVSESTAYKLSKDTGVDGLTAITNIKHNIVKFQEKYENIYMINIETFEGFTKVQNEIIKNKSVKDISKNGLKIKSSVNKLPRDLIFNYNLK